MISDNILIHEVHNIYYILYIFLLIEILCHIIVTYILKSMKSHRLFIWYENIFSLLNNYKYLYNFK